MARIDAAIAAQGVNATAAAAVAAAAGTGDGAGAAAAAAASSASSSSSSSSGSASSPSASTAVYAALSADLWSALRQHHWAHDLGVFCDYGLLGSSDGLRWGVCVRVCVSASACLFICSVCLSIYLYCLHTHVLPPSLRLTSPTYYPPIGFPTFPHTASGPTHTHAPHRNRSSVTFRCGGGSDGSTQDVLVSVERVKARAPFCPPSHPKPMYPLGDGRGGVGVREEYVLGGSFLPCGCKHLYCNTYI